MGTLLRLTLVVVLAGIGSCTGARVNPAGRPCSATEPCGPGTYCNEATNTCEVAHPDLALLDLPQSHGDADLGPPDLLPPPDRYLVPDGGCPAGYTACGTECAKLSESFDHCGQCNKPCDPGVSNKCVASKCVCGSAGGPCTDGLNCKADQCTCIFAGECIGCCDGTDTCLPLGPSQSASKCGGGGIPCKGCDDSDPCTNDECLATGQCGTTPGPDGDPCNDNTACTHTDQCSGGSCAGTPYTCNDGLTCTTDSCTGLPPPNQCTAALKSGNCLIDNSCYADQGTHSTDPCLKCLVSKSTSEWSQASGCVFTFAGSTPPGHADGPLLAAKFSSPSALAMDSTGKIYVVDRDNQVIRLISGGQVSTFAGTVGVTGGANGPALSATFNQPNGLALDSTGTKLYVAEWSGDRIRLISGGQVTTFAGTGAAGYLDGQALSAQFDGPFDLAVYGAKVYVADRGNHRIRLIESGQVTTFAGSGSSTFGGFVNGPVASARFNTPHAIAVDSSGNVYVADFSNNCIRLISGGQVSTFAGQCPSSGLVNGSLTTARFYHPAGIALGSGGKVYVSDEGNQVIRLISGGQVSTLAGSTLGFLDGPVAQAKLYNPRRLIADSAGLVYVPDADNDRIRLIRP